MSKTSRAVGDGALAAYRAILVALDAYRSANDLPPLITALTAALNELDSELSDVLEPLREEWQMLVSVYDQRQQGAPFLGLTTALEGECRRARLSLRRLAAQRIGAPMHAFPCPCCGHLVFDEPPGSYDICPVCFWEDDPVQLKFPLLGGGANRLSLVEAQVSFRTLGAAEPRLFPHVRPAGSDEPLERSWRPFDPAVDKPLAHPTDEWPDDYTHLYYWRDTYWRR